MRSGEFEPIGFMESIVQLLATTRVSLIPTAAKRAARSAAMLRHGLMQGMRAMTEVLVEGGIAAAPRLIEVPDAAAPPRPIEVLDIDRLARRFMWFQRTMRLYRMVLAYATLAAVFIIPVVMVVSLVALSSAAPLTGAAAIGALWLVLLAFCYGFAYLYRRCMAGSRRAVVWLSGGFLALYLVAELGLLAEQLSAPLQDQSGIVVAQLFILVIVAPIVLGVVGFLRTRSMSGAALIADHNYSTGFRQLRGLGRDLLRVMGIPTLPAQPILPALAVMALAAFGLEGIVLNAYTQSLPAALADLATADPVLVLRGVAVLALSAAIALLAMAAARALRRRARRRALLSAEAARLLDPRPPILFLRAFRDDQVSLATARLPLLMRLIDPGSIGGTLEELIVQEYTGLGPVVAIGDPTHPLPPLGVSRMYCSGASWQDTVNGLMQQSARIVIAVDSSAAIGPQGVPTGLAWEITRLRDKGVLDKTIFVWPPQDARAPDALERLLRLIDPAGRIARPRITGACLALCLRPSGDALLLTAPHATEVEYTLALRAPRLAASTDTAVA
jgi:hypothetical protein